MRRGVSTIALVAAMTGWAGSVQAQTPPQTPDEANLGEIVVTGQRGAIASARAAERNNDNLTNVVSADSVGQFGDQNTAEALQRLPGITIERNEGEGRTVAVRGLPSSFTQVTINGARVGTSEAGDSTVALDVVPSDLLGQIEVSKTYTANMDGDTIGGAVELKSLSAFGGTGEITTFRAEGVSQEYADKWGPKLSASLARRLMGGDLGVAATVNYSLRYINGDDLRNEDGFLSITRNGDSFLYPVELNQRYEVGERERFGGSINLEYRPRDNFELFLRAQYTQLNDDDTRVQLQWQTERSTGNEVREISDAGGRFNDVRKRYQVFFQPTEDKLYTISAGGRSVFENGLELTYQADFSRSNWIQEDGLRPRFEIDDIQALASYDRDSLTVETFRESATRPDPTSLAAYRYTNLLFIEEERIDDIAAVKWDAKAPLAAFGEEGYLQFGAKIRMRDKEADKIEYNGDPRAAGFPLSYADIATFMPDSPSFGPNFGPFAQFDPLRDLAERSRDALLANPTFLRRDNSVASDYQIGEDVSAAYLLGNIALSERLRLIAGARVERTEFSSRGFFFESDDSGLTPVGAPTTAVDLGTYSRAYTDWLPSALIRWEPTDDLVIRASYGRGVKRPDFDDARNSQAIRFDSADPEDSRNLEAGNPFLEALVADQFDASVAWYPNRSTVLQVALFHKDIRNFFIDFETDDISLTSIVLPAGTNLEFDNIETVINGAEAKVSGVELSYTQAFDFLPGVLSGLFVEGNVTLAESEAEISERPGESFAFPGQSDVSGNLSIGWENDIVSVRLAGNHRGEVLSSISSDPREDEFRDAYTQYDVNLRWNVTPSLQIYADGVNLTGEKDVRYYQGGRVPLFAQVQDFGASYQIGLRASF